MSAKTKAESFSPKVPPLKTLYAFLLRSFDLQQYRQESFLMAIYILRKSISHVTVQTVQEEILDDPTFYDNFLIRCTNYSNPFVHSSVMELIESILSPATYPSDTDVHSKIDTIRLSVRTQVSRILREKKEMNITQFMLDIINLLSIPVTEGSDATSNTSDVITVDNQTCSFLLDLLQQQTLTTSTVGLWWVVLSLVRRSDPSYLLENSTPVVNVFSMMLSSTDEVQGMMSDVFGELVRWLFTQPGSAELCSKMFGKLMSILTKINDQMFKDHVEGRDGLSSSEERRAVKSVTTTSECVILCRIVSGSLIVKNNTLLTRPISQLEIIQAINCVAITTRVMFPSLEGKTELGHEYDGMSGICEHLVQLLSGMCKEGDRSDMDQIMTTICTNKSQCINHLVHWLGEQKSLTAKPRPVNALATNEREEWKANILKIVLQLASFGGQQSRNYMLGVTFQRLRTVPSASLAQLCQLLVTDEETAMFFMIDLNGFNLLVGQLVAGNGTSQANATAHSGAIHLTSNSLINLQSSTTPTHSNTPHLKTSKPGAMENFSAMAQLVSNDTQLSNIFKDFTGNGTVWTRKCPAGSKDSEFRIKIKLPFPILLKQVTSGVKVTGGDM